MADINSRLVRFICVLVFGINLTACATATRGSHTMFVVETTPIGAKATTTLATKDSPEISNQLRGQIEAGDADLPEISYQACEPTPCGIKVPRRSNFHVLVTKDGYAPVLAEIGNMHRKEIKKETVRNTAIAAGASGVAGAVAVGSVVSSLGSGSVTAAAAGGAAVFAVPVILIGGTAIGVDAVSGANYDVWPNPLPLQIIETEPENAESEAALIDEFENLQRSKSLEPPLTATERKAMREATRLRLRQALQTPDKKGS